ncbi:T9SS type A sorting domain-containing protein [Roseivirga pacifica]|uniref:DUF4961 domain-containing protein n=1 Tax=Roseivirga pacifica TaxID=1267423 RepID=UPI0020943E0A|nr:alpha-amylase family glycosyl hydrolase [Roseivirga pacifica]MCO6357635.1 T9SS type A sorting domain-containing protein [Roseivirga pacifica]MCO6365888.1 T9SS type A sorting domain-containing protein [Roseivirga pacifica]MCO6375613.1 T9SS type A sorting domain-containing protein [Roseivirga pacifica]MCO6378594.1 T9SS type A sorting domain-containing protein [Roseivirga pacifica]
MRTLFTALLVLCLSFAATAQIVKIEPANATADDEIKLVFDATQGDAGLVGAASVYMHGGVITESPTATGWDDRYVVGNWGADDGIGKMTKVSGETDKWEITLTPSAREYYGVPAGTNVFRLAMVFRNADGSAKGAGTPGTIDGGSVSANGDIFIDLNISNYITINAPTSELLFVEQGGSVTFAAETTDEVSAMSMSLDLGNGFQEVANVNSGTSISYDFYPQEAVQGQMKVNATVAGEDLEVIQNFNIQLRGTAVVAELPAGLKKGINYHEDLSMVTLVLEAPNKEFAYVVGDMNDWQVNENYLMNQTPDGELFWLTLDGLTENQEYVFQYWVDGTIKVGDPYSDKVADPWNDQYIESSVHNAVPEYSFTDYAIATTFQTGQTPFEWDASEASWERPAKEDLVIYELLVRDFIGTHDYDDLIDTLGYIKGLGVNAIELMPIMEFEGNESWGYNPMYFFAPDKYYGTKDDLKNFIQACHQEGIAVILDMVLNHAFGLNPMVRMYWDDGAGKPSANSPWFNQDPTHPYNVGYDFNHESTYTQAFVDSVNAYWLQEYHFDGYRFDLSKGFTQTNNPNNVGAWGNYDQSRVDILTRMADKLWEVDSEAYVILEHFADASEEAALADEGMLLWRNLVYAYYKALGGQNNESFTGGLAETHVTYMESHDEQRQIFEVMHDGASEGSYNTRSLDVALDRLKMNAAFIYLLPGPKMLWQFGELGYDIDIDQNGRTGNKPLPWGTGGLDYYTDEERAKVLQAFKAIINLRTQNPTWFQRENYAADLTGDTRKFRVDNNDTDIVVYGNFGLSEVIENVPFTQTGEWFDYITGESITVDNTSHEVNMLPGEFRIYTSTKVSEGFGDIVNVYSGVVTSIEDELPNFTYYPNPTTGKLYFKGEVPGRLKAVEMVDMQGNSAFSVGVENNQLEAIDVSGTKPGLYLLHLITETKKYTLKVMVKH